MTLVVTTPAAVAGGGGGGLRSRRSGSRSSEAICIVYILYVHMHMIITFRDRGDHFKVVGLKNLASTNTC